MSDENVPNSAGEQETFGFIDDEEENEESLEEDILDADDYREADRYGMTADEERRGTPLSVELAGEEPDEPPEPWEPEPEDSISDEPAF